MKILVGDDDATFRLLLHRLIQKWGHEPVLAPNGAAAWDHLSAADGPRLAILDWVMPEVDGLELCRRARSGSLPHYVYIILLTARRDPADLLAGLEAGADDYLTKPASLEELRLRVNTAARIAALNSQQHPAELHVAQLRRLFGELVRAQDAERSKIAHELHEGIAQTVSGISMGLWCMREAKQDAPREADLSVLISTSQACVRDIQALSYRLHPPLLDEIGLETALWTYAERATQDPGIELQIDVQAQFGRLEHDLEVTLFRIVQEAVGNLSRQYGCPRALIRLDRDGEGVRLRVQGKDGQQNATAGGLSLGVLEMKERAEQFNGSFDIWPTGDGAVMTVVLPCR